MFDLIASVLAFFYDNVWDSYGVSVILLTLAVMIIATPLTLKSTKSMLQMQRLQPELKAIQNKYKDGDRAKMNEELMAFYQENGINPLGGCLPMLVQLPIFLVLFRVVQGITRRSTGIGTQFGWSSGRVGAASSGNEIILDANTIGSTERTFDPENLPVDSDMYQSLTGETEMVSWGIDLSRTAQNVLSDNFIDALPYLGLIVVVLISSLYQQRQIQGRNTGAQINPQQQMIMRILPFMLPVFSFTMPAALVIYFVVSNLYRIGQQAYITQSLYKGDDSPGQQLARQRAAEKTSGKSGADRSSGGRTTPKKGEPTPKQGAKGSGKQGSKKQGSGKQSAKSQSSKKQGAGRTGKAPSRQSRGSGRVTEPGAPQHKKRKK